MYKRWINEKKIGDKYNEDAKTADILFKHFTDLKENERKLQ